MLRGFIFTVLYLAFLSAILFVSAGRVDWPMGWLTMGAYAAVSVLTLLRVDPALVRERLLFRSEGNASDRILASLSFLFFLPATLLVAGLDFGRFGWTAPLALPLRLSALAVFAFGYGFAGRAMVVNRYFSTFVVIQRERGHRVVSDGPYRFVRHPGYAGTACATLALPVALGSLWALLPAVAGVVLLSIRTVCEDSMLMRHLPGYREYSRRVRHRLVPGVW